MQFMISSVKITEIQRFYIMHAIHAKMNKKVLTFAHSMESEKNMLNNVCLGFFGTDAILAHAQAWDLVR